MSIQKRTLKRPDPVTSRKTAYLVRVEGRRDPLTGKRKQYSKQVPTMGEAKRLEAEWTAEIARGTALDPTKLTVGDLLDQWLASMTDLTENSRLDYEIIIRRHIKPALGDVLVQRLTAAQVIAQRDAWHAAGMSPRLIRGCLMRLSQALDIAVQLQLVSTNVSTSVKRPAVPRATADNTWSAVDVRRFLETAADDSMWPLWPLLVLEGMRRGEALGLRWSDINWARGTAHIVQTVKPDKANKGRAIIEAGTKTKTSARTVRLTQTTLEALEVHRAEQLKRRMAIADWEENDLIVCTGRGTPINPGNVIRSFDRIVAQADLRRIRVHDLRHTAATLLLLAGEPAKVVSERLGHKSIAITLDLYSHVLPDMQDSAAEAMDRLLENAAIS